MSENTWFDDGDRGAHRPAHQQVRSAVAKHVRRWAVVLCIGLIAAAAWWSAGEPPPPGPVDVAGLAALVALAFVWGRTESLGGIAAVGFVLSMRATALQGPLALSVVWLLVGLFAAGSLRQARAVEGKHEIRPTGRSAAIVAAVAALGSIAAVVVFLVVDVALALEGVAWCSALAAGVGLAGGSADHPGRRVALAAAGVGAMGLALLLLLVVLAYSG